MPVLLNGLARGRQISTNRRLFRVDSAFWPLDCLGLTWTANICKRIEGLQRSEPEDISETDKTKIALILTKAEIFSIVTC